MNRTVAVVSGVGGGGGARRRGKGASVTEGVLKRLPSGFELPLVGRQIVRLSVNVGTLELGFDDFELAHELFILVPFTVTRWGQVWKLDPGKAESLHPVLGLLSARPVAAIAEEGGALRLLFPDASLDVEPAPYLYGAWEFQRQDGLRVRGKAPGELSVGSGDEPRRRGRKRKREG